MAATDLRLPSGYTATVLPLVPFGINDQSVIVGSVYLDAAAYANGVVTMLRHLPGATVTKHEARAISNDGRIVGIADWRGIYWASVNAVPLEIVPPYRAEVVPVAVNSSGIVVGTFKGMAVGSRRRAFRWTPNGGFADITPTGYAEAEAKDVNEQGYIAGRGWCCSASPPYDFLRALVWSPDLGPYAHTVYGNVAVAIENNGMTLTNFTNWSYELDSWYGPWNGVPGKVNAPWPSTSDDVSENGRIVGYLLHEAQIYPYQQPWTLVDTTVTYLPIAFQATTDSVANMRVNTCGSIIGTRIPVSGPRAGLLWTKLTCDGTPSIASAPTIMY